MSTLKDDLAAHLAAKANVAPLQAAAAAADQALADGLALVKSTGDQVKADVDADGAGYVGPAADNSITVVEPSSTDPGFNLEVIPPADSLPGGLPVS
jgi:protein-disulfide isomerase